MSSSATIRGGRTARGAQKRRKGGAKSPAVAKAMELIEGSGAKVKVNPKNTGLKQEGNVTLDFGGGSRVNVRVETHPLKSGGPPTRHANVEVVDKVNGKNVVRRNDHITDDIEVTR